MRKLLFFMLFLPFFSVEAMPVVLKYPKGTWVEQTIETTMEREVDYPAFFFKEEVRQKIVASMMLVNDRELELVLRRIVTHNRSNDFYFESDTDVEQNNLENRQLRQLIGRPLKIRFREDLSVDQNELFERLEQELPLASKSINQKLFSEIVHYLFVFANKEVQAGDQFQYPFMGSISDHRKMTLNYEVNSADFREVQATLTGRLEATEMQWEEGGGITVEGVVSGKGSWQHDNALLSQIKVHHSYSGLLHNEEQRAPIHLKFIQMVTSQPQL